MTTSRVRVRALRRLRSDSSALSWITATTWPTSRYEVVPVTICTRRCGCSASGRRVMVAFLVLDDEVRVVGVFYGGRDAEAILTHEDYDLDG